MGELLEQSFLALELEAMLQNPRRVLNYLLGVVYVRGDFDRSCQEIFSRLQASCPGLITQELVPHELVGRLYYLLEAKLMVGPIVLVKSQLELPLIVVDDYLDSLRETQEFTGALGHVYVFHACGFPAGLYNLLLLIIRTKWTLTASNLLLLVRSKLTLTVSNLLLLVVTPKWDSAVSNLLLTVTPK